MTVKFFDGNSDQDSSQTFDKFNISTAEIILRNQSFIMNNLLKKMPNLGLKVFRELNNQSLLECQKVNKLWKTFIESQKFYWIRIIQTCDKYKQEVYSFSSKNFLNKILQKSNYLAVKQMAIEAQNGNLEQSIAIFFTKAYFIPSKKYFSKKKFDDLKEATSKDDSNGTTPIHYAAEFGHLTICLLMIKKMKEKCPKTKMGCTPLHTAAYYGHLEVCRLMMEFSRDNNPKDSDLGRTPLHWAAKNGHLDVCRLIIDNIKDKNPKTLNGVTPLHLAARYGHVSICQLILENISDLVKNKHFEIKNPPNKSGWTPLHLATEFGQYRVVQLILKHVENKNPKNKKSRETTPLELADFYGYSTLSFLIQSAIDRQTEPAEKKPRKTYSLRLS